MQTRFIFSLIIILMTSFSVQAQEMRQFKPVKTPSARETAAVREGRLVPVPAADVKDFSDHEVRGAMDNFAQKWNSGQMSDMISDTFYDKSRLADSMEEQVPKDTQMRINSVKGMQTIDQKVIRGDDGKLRRVSTVTVIADTQLDFNDPSAGFVSVPGTNEFVFTVTEEVQ